MGAVIGGIEMTYNLNRIFVISGASAETAERPIQWRMDWQTGIGAPGTASPQLPSAGRYGFARGFLNLWTHSDVFDTDSLLSVAPPVLLLPALSVKADGTPDDALPRLEVSLKDASLEDVWIRFGREDAPDSFIEWTATGRQDFYADSQFFQEFFFVQIESPELVGAAFSWARDDGMVITVEGQTLAAPVSETQGKKIWGNLIEYGVTADVLAIGSVETLTPGEESARLTIRYDGKLARGRKAVDDLNREWDIRGSRAIQERRYLQFDLTRRVQN